MDNLTHSLVGALLGQMGLKRKTGLAMPTLIIAANIPDIDAVAVLLGGHQHLAIRRGITHGPIAMVLLPLLLWGAMLWFDRWQTRRGTRPDKRPPVNAKWLLMLAYVGCLSHPLFDWFNSYGIRLLEPFSSQWFYGDTLFIIDIWIWVALIASVWLSRRREKRGTGNWHRPAWIGFTAICAYIFANGLITERAERHGAELVEKTYEFRPTLVVANAVPIKFWERELLWRRQPHSDGGFYFGGGEFSMFRGARLVHFQNTIGGGYTVKTDGVGPVKFDRHRHVGLVQDDVIKIARRQATKNADVRAFLFWSRMPLYNVYNKGKDGYVFEITDHRFRDPRVGDRFTVTVPCVDRCE